MHEHPLFGDRITGPSRDTVLPMRTVPVHSLTVNGIALAYQDLGSGSPLLLINGFASPMDTWNPLVLDDLARRHRIVIFDSRGTGYSSAGDPAFSIPLFAQDAAALLAALGIARAHILGLSMGASVAQELALFRPGLVDRLILVAGTCGGNRGIRMRPEVWETLSDKTGTPRDVARRMFSVLFTPEWLMTHDPWSFCPEVRETTSPESAALQAEAFFSWPGSWDRLPEIRSPALVLTGTEDVVIPPGNSSILAGRIPGARLVRFSGAGHGLMYQCPGEFGRVVGEFLRTIG